MFGRGRTFRRDDLNPLDDQRSRTGLIRWGAHVAFWLTYFVIRTAAAAADPPAEYREFPFVANRALVVASYLVMTSVILVMVSGWRADRVGRPRNLAMIAAAILIIPFGHIAEEFWPNVLGAPPDRSGSTFSYFFMFGWVLPIWGLTQALLGYHFQIQEQNRAIVRAQKLAHDAQLRMLHYQINPHFLFNTLNAISTLVLEGRNDHAERMLLGLSGFLRYSLDRQPEELAPLAAEIAAQRKYLDIEQTRFGDKLTVAFDIEPGLDAVALPSLILQPILENAIKYAITPSAAGGHIEVTARRDHGVLRISIEDDGPGIDENAPRRRGAVGIANARERLAVHYGSLAGLKVENKAPTGCRVEIWLPLSEEHLARTVAPAAG